MSRELLKRAAVVLREVWDNDDCYCAPSVIELQKEIVAYLAQPEPEPINKYHPDYHRVLLGCKPDQSAQIAELEKYAMENSISAYRDSNNRLTDQIEQLEQQLAALQAKRDPLSDDEIQDIHNELPSRSTYYEFARAIEAAHGIGTNHD